MRALWHLATNSLAGRRGRTALLALAVACATALTVGVAAAIDTVRSSLRQVVGRVAGLADLSIEQRFGGALPNSLLQEVRSWPQVEQAAPRVEGSATIRCKRTGAKAAATLSGLEPAAEEQVSPVGLLAGRGIRAAGETVIGERLRRRLDANVGDVLEVVGPGGTGELAVVGILARPGLGMSRRPAAIAQLAQVQGLLGQPDRLDEIRLRLRGGVEAEVFTAAHAGRLPEGAVFQTPAAAQARIGRHLRLAELLLAAIITVGSLSSAFLILTSLTTAAAQRTREMAILRCIGASRLLLAAAQLGAGGLISLLGAAVGTPLGVLAAYGLYWRFQESLPGGFAVDPAGAAGAVAGSLAAGLLGAAYPAFLAATARPAEALAVRARPTERRHVAACAAGGLALAAAQPLALALFPDSDWVLGFWTYFGLPAAFAGYFLLSVPLLIGLVVAAARPVGRLLRLPGALLAQSMRATPMRHGFTAGTLMVGMAILVAVWTHGQSMKVGWFERLRMPDAFLYRFPSLGEEQVRTLRSVPAATAICPAVMLPVRTPGKQLGIPGISPPNTLFVGADMASFLRMTDLDWYQGRPDEALRRLATGGAVLVSREWSVAHGVGVGGRMALDTARGRVDFQVVGVVGSGGLELATHSFGVRRRMAEVSLGSVFGTLADAKRYFGVEAVNLVLVSLRNDVTDEEAIRQLTQAVPGGVVGTSREVLRHVRTSLDRIMAVLSTLAAGSLALACLGLGNLIAAEVATRRFEFGVLRAVGAQRGLLGRLIAGQTLLIALAGCAAGTALGVQVAMVGRSFDRRFGGAEYSLHLPAGVIASGAAVILGAALAAALPTIWRLLRQPPRALFARRE